MKKLFIYLVILFTFSNLLVGCNKNTSEVNSLAMKRDLTVALENSFKGQIKNNKVIEINSITDSMFSPDLNFIFGKADEVVRGTVKNIEYTNYSGLAWTKADILITESYKGVLKEGDLVSIFMYGGYIKLEDHIKYYKDDFRFESMTDNEIKNTILEEKDNGKPLIKVGDDLFFPLIKPAEHMPFPEGSFENLSVAGILHINKDGKFIQDYYDEGKKTTKVFTVDEVKNKV